MESLVVWGFEREILLFYWENFWYPATCFFPFCNLTSLLYSAKIYFKVPQGNGLPSGNLSPGTTRIFSEFWVSLCTFLRLFSQMSALFALLPLPTAWNSAHLSIFGQPFSSAIRPYILLLCFEHYFPSYERLGKHAIF